MFDDLEHRFAHLEELELRAQAEELTRAERADVLLADRLRAAHGTRIGIVLRSAERLVGSVGEVGDGWCELTGTRGPRRALVRTEAIALVEALGARARPLTDANSLPRSLQSHLRARARDRVHVLMHTEIGHVAGRIIHVGADAIDLRRLPTGERSDLGTAAGVTVPLRALHAIEEI